MEKPWIAAVRMPSGNIMKFEFDTKAIAQAYIDEIKARNPDRKLVGEVIFCGSMGNAKP